MTEPEEFHGMHRGQLVATIVAERAAMKAMQEDADIREQERDTCYEEAQREKARADAAERMNGPLYGAIAEAERERDEAKSSADRREADRRDAVIRAQQVEARAERLAAAVRRIADKLPKTRPEVPAMGCTEDEHEDYVATRVGWLIAEELRAALADAPESKPCCDRVTTDAEQLQTLLETLGTDDATARIITQLFERAAQVEDLIRERGDLARQCERLIGERDAARAALADAPEPKPCAGCERRWLCEQLAMNPEPDDPNPTVGAVICADENTRKRLWCEANDGACSKNADVLFYDTDREMAWLSCVGHAGCYADAPTSGREEGDGG